MNVVRVVGRVAHGHGNLDDAAPKGGGADRLGNEFDVCHRPVSQDLGGDLEAPVALVGPVAARQPGQPLLERPLPHGHGEPPGPRRRAYARPAFCALCAARRTPGGEIRGGFGDRPEVGRGAGRRVGGPNPGDDDLRWPRRLGVAAARKTGVEGVADDPDHHADGDQPEEQQSDGKAAPCRRGLFLLLDLGDSGLEDDGSRGVGVDRVGIADLGLVDREVGRGVDLGHEPV